MISYGVAPAYGSEGDPCAPGMEKALRRILHAISAAGFQGVQSSQKTPAAPETLGPAMRRFGVRLISCLHPTRLFVRSLEEEKQAIQPYLEALLALDCHVCVVGEPAPEDRPDAEGMRRFHAAIEALAEHCAMQGVDLAYRHHLGGLVRDRAEIDALLAATGPAVGLALDTGHAFLAGADITALARDHIGRVRHIHARNVRGAVLAQARAERLDFTEAMRMGLFCGVDDPAGDVDFAPLLSIAARQRYRGWLVLDGEIEHTPRGEMTFRAEPLTALRAMARRAGLGY